MKNLGTVLTLIFATILVGCNSEKSKTISESETLNHTTIETDTLTKHLKPFK